MASTKPQIVERVRHLIGQTGSEEASGIFDFQIEAAFSDAGIELARMALDGDALARQYLTTSWTITLSGGNYPISGASYYALEIRSLPMATVTHGSVLASDGNPRPLVYLPDPQDLYWPQPGQDVGAFAYYTVENEVIRTRDQNGAIDALTGSLTLRNAIFRPVVHATDSSQTTLPEQLEDAFIALVRDKMLAKLAGAPATEGA